MVSIKFYGILFVMENIQKAEPKLDSKKESFWELARFTILAILVVIPIRIFIAQPFVVSGSSMDPTFKNGEYLIVDELSYHLGEPKRGDVAIFRYPNNTKKFFIKRVIGLPNEVLEINNNVVTIFNADNKNGLVLNEPYVKNLSNKNGRYELGEDEYFMLGDNRTASSDSRYWGSVDRHLIVGRAFLRLLPLNKIDTMPGALEENY